MQLFRGVDYITMDKLVTDLDEFFSIVREMEEVTMKELSHLMRVEIDLIERWAKALSRVGMLSMHYPMLTGDKGKVTVRYKTDQLQPRTRAYLEGGFLLPRYA